MNGRVALIASAIAAMLGSAHAETVALLVPALKDDARQAIALGPHGEVYAPDGTGAWVRTQRIATANDLVVAGRAGGDVVAAGDGAVYKLAPNGWSAIRLHQKDKATMASGSRAVAAVKRQLYALDRTRRGEPEKLAVAPAAILAIGAGKTIVIATDRGLARVEGKQVTPIAGAPRRVVRLVDDRWAIVDTGVYDLRAGKSIAWPTGAKFQAATAVDDKLVAVVAIGRTRELITIAKGALARQVIDATPAGTAVGVVVDKAGRVVVALADGRMLLRDRGTWTATVVKDALPAARPGPAPARVP